MRPINHYFGPYGTLAGLRAHNLRSFFVRIKSPFDLPNGEDRTKNALEPFRTKLGHYECGYCGANAEVWDHLIDASKGGPHQLGNLLPACRSCNCRKNSWQEQLEKVAGQHFEVRKARIEEYITFLQPGHTIFDDEDLVSLKKAEEQLFDAIERVDKIIIKATEKFRSKAGR